MIKRILKYPVMALIIIIFLWSGCSLPDPASFVFSVPYTTIRSNPGGGGLFIVSIKPGSEFIGTVQLELTADPALHAALSLTALSAEVPVTDITLCPDTDIPIRDYTVNVTAVHNPGTRSQNLTVQIMDWESIVSEAGIAKRDTFVTWIVNNRTDIGFSAPEEWTAYNTYPEIIIVEHWTFLSPEWELRVCLHAMIEPYDWSKARLRKRSRAEPLLALSRDSDTLPIEEIPVEEYPVLFDY